MTLEIEGRALIVEGKAIVERTDEDSWRLAEIVNELHELGMTYRAIATEFGWKNHATARHYVGALGYHDIQERFADAFLFAGMSDEKLAAVQLVADDDGISPHTAKTRTEQVNYYKDIFKDADPEVLKAALKDKDARSRLRELSVETVMEDQPALVKDKRVDPGPSAKPLSNSSKAERKVIQDAMAEIMHFSRATILRAEKSTEKFRTAMPNLWWEKYVPGETVHRNHEAQVIGDIDRAIESLEVMKNEVQRVIDKAKVTS